MKQAQHAQLKWLQNTLAHQLHTTRTLEHQSNTAKQEEADDAAESHDWCFHPPAALGPVPAWLRHPGPRQGTMG